MLSPTVGGVRLVADEKGYKTSAIIRLSMLVKEKNMTTEHLIGHCQICDREIGSTLGRIAHHGYRRPGNGEQTSSCPGARCAPFETAHDALDAHIVDVAAQEAALREKITNLTKHRIPIPNRDYSTWVYCGSRGPQPPELIENGDLRYDSRRDEYLRSLQYELESLERYIAWQHTRLDAWTPRDLAAVAAEIARTGASEREARKQEAARKRAERQIKADALRAKRTAFYAQPCEFAVEHDGARYYCWTHGLKVMASHYRGKPRVVTGERCYDAKQWDAKNPT